MNVHITHKQLELTDSITAYVKQRAEKLPKYWSRVTRADVDMEKRGGHTYWVEFIVHAEGHDPFVSHHKHDDLYACIDEAASRAERQLRDHHAKLTHH
ncbi:ribosome hibernation-promoting factor, HPF/YfiA family [Phycisphaera mikurensis]|uniref:Ribosome hibernation promoting factor n=1 Tax=Phycisphaera mikurensis (strain NBRC 102666 / KCTC 22515 / FYK2301M01) TaxID=1142394 RepID=I0IAV9_PHYMF|nr:ribosome-associated translation inhibitor RaiA [Phycisphaera mikurensis]MBB6442629.1 ribosomal subunit interface protein [Phycisphaera mikurensis]BAM02397.1 hypothetical protein PSMK_02380 [Phycisphaera mikurensis NBRC 102666]